jgi:serine/threonine protein kinase
MEFCDSDNLRVWLIKRAGNWFSIFRQLVKGVAYIHLKRIIHKDLKPENIFLSEGEIVKIGDFGLSESGATQVDVNKKQKGTPLYMAPELLWPEPEITYKVDSFSLGIILFELISDF